MLLAQLPDDVLLGVLRALMRNDGSQHAQNLRDLWNIATTCKRMYVMVTRMMSALHTTSIIAEGSRSCNVPTVMPDDVVQGTLFALRVIRDGEAVNKLGTVRLCAMAGDKLQIAVDRLRACTQLRVLSFVDVDEDVSIPAAVACRIKKLAITSPRAQTMRHLDQMQYVPRLMFSYEDFIMALDLLDAWVGFTRRIINTNVTWLSVSGVEDDESYEDGGRGFLADSLWQDDCLHVGSGFLGASFGPPPTTAMSVYERLVAQIGFEPVLMSQWRPNQTGQLRTTLVQFEETDVLSLIVDTPLVAEQLLQDECALMRSIVNQMLAGFNAGPTLRLLVWVPAISPIDGEDMHSLRKAAAKLAVYAARKGGFRQLLVRAPVFVALKNMVLPESVSNVGVVGVEGESVCTNFVNALPAVLAALTCRTATAPPRSVWMQHMKVLDCCNDLCTAEKLRHALSACRLAEAKGLCVVTVRGCVEQWLQESNG